MSLLPEIIFRAIITRGFRAIREDSRLVDQLIRNLDQESAEEIRAFFSGKDRIAIDVNYPREALKIPAIILLLRSETESQAFLSDYMGCDPPDALSFDNFDDDPLEVLGGAATVSDLSGLGKKETEPALAAGGTTNVLSVEGFPWKSSQFTTRPHTIHLIGGTGAGQQAVIIANGGNTIMIDGNWNPIPDTTTVFIIRSAAEEVIGEPRAIYQRDVPVERLGSYYNMSYQVQIIGPNPEFTIILHAIVRSIFTLARTALERQGILNMQMGATDFLPRTEYQPDFTYMRALNVDFIHPFSVFNELGGLAKSFRITLEQCIEGGVLILSESEC